MYFANFFSLGAPVSCIVLALFYLFARASVFAQHENHDQGATRGTLEMDSGSKFGKDVFERTKVPEILNAIKTDL